MYIAFIISESFCISPNNGIRIQAETWATELERQGHIVKKIDPWECQDWTNFDIIHLFGWNEFLLNLHELPNRNIVFSPIIDSFQPIWKYRLASYWGIKRLRLNSTNNAIRRAIPFIKMWCVRTRFEYQYVCKAYGISPNKVAIIPLSFRVSSNEYIVPKEQCCLHVSRITQDRKNVERLVEASKKYGFNLLLAGSVDESYKESDLKRKIEQYPNVQYLGRLSDENLLNLYKRVKVFALPSIGEGVGLVALEAAACGCVIVVTNIGGPKEYYGNMAYVVNPYSIDDIGSSVLKALEDTKCQPRLMKYVQKEYALEVCVKRLIDTCYKGVEDSEEIEFD